MALVPEPIVLTGHAEAPQLRLFVMALFFIVGGIAARKPA